MSRANYASKPAYTTSKLKFVEQVARHGRQALRATWCVAESGTSGPEFRVPGVEAGFTAIAVSGPVDRVVLVESPGGDRAHNMRLFSRKALELLEQCIVEAVDSKL